MLNQIILVGRLANDIQINETENNKKVATITLAVPRSFKNKDGLYDTDFINCTLWNGVATNTSEYCNKGDIIGIKGRVQNNNNNLEILTEKVTFLSAKKEYQEEKEDDEEIERTTENKEEDYEIQ